MIKRTLYFGNPAYLSLKDRQLVVQFPGDQGEAERSGRNKIPAEDVGLVVLDHRQITITHGLLQELLDNKALIVSCGEDHHPAGMLHSLEGHSEQSKRMAAQVESSEPLRKNLWQQTIAQKIRNQAAMLRERSIAPDVLERWSRQVKSGDPDNLEGRAAAHYWDNVFPELPVFLRERKGHPPNAWLNYGYAILRASMARSIVAAGLNPSLGIHHHNKYNAWCLADDLMEAYRPWADLTVYRLMMREELSNEVTKEVKIAMLGLPATDVRIGGEKSPMMVAMQKTVNSLVRCYLGEVRKLLLPEFEIFD
jgi:CRISPR-associated protein Cas1